MTVFVTVSGAQLYGDTAMLQALKALAVTKTKPEDKLCKLADGGVTSA